MFWVGRRQGKKLHYQSPVCISSASAVEPGLSEGVRSQVFKFYGVCSRHEKRDRNGVWVSMLPIVCRSRTVMVVVDGNGGDGLACFLLSVSPGW